MLWCSEKLQRRRLLNDLALRKETHAVREFFRESHLVSHHQHGEIMLAAQPPNHVQHFTAQLGIERYFTYIVTKVVKSMPDSVPDWE